MRIVKRISGIEGRIKCSQHIRPIAQKDKRPEMLSSHSCVTSVEIIKEISDEVIVPFSSLRKLIRSTLKQDTIVKLHYKRSSIDRIIGASPFVGGLLGSATTGGLPNVEKGSRGNMPARGENRP